MFPFGNSLNMFLFLFLLLVKYSLVLVVSPEAVHFRPLLLYVFFKATLVWFPLIHIQTIQDNQIQISFALNGITYHNVDTFCNEQHVASMGS